MKGSPYPVLRNRPIDQWKVTELKDELKRRKLTVKGLKEELVRRLDEALREEMESADQEKAENGNDSGSDEDDDADEIEKPPIAVEPINDTAEVDEGVDVIGKDAEIPAIGNNVEDTDVAVEAAEVDTSDAAVEAAEVDTSDVAVETAEVDTSDVAVETAEVDTSDVVVAASLVFTGKISDENLGEQEVPAEADTSDAANNDKKSVEGDLTHASPTENLDSATQLDVNPLDEEMKTIQNSQVSEVSASLGFTMKNVSVSTDSISVNEKNELKEDNIIVDDVKLELDVKHELVKSSSSPLVPDGGESRPMDVEEPQSKISLDETKKTIIDEDMSKKNSSADLGSPEKLNLDRSSGDDSMEEDTLENKQVDSTYKPVDVGGSVEKTGVTVASEETTIDIEGDVSAVKKDALDNDVVAIAASTEKRKLPDNHELIASNEPSKRQRRWKTEAAKAPEPQSSSPAIPVSTTPRGVTQALGTKRSFSRSNSNADDDTLKERIVPPSSVETPTDSLRIDNFLRPFTLKAVHELLGKTGTVTSFWMDHIKTHCYVTYSSVEEATETRNAVYNLQWPPYGGRLLAAKFVDAQEVKSHIEGPPQLPSPIAPVIAPSADPLAPLLPSPRQLGSRQKQLPLTNLPPPPPLANPPPARERLLPPPPPLEKVEPPVVTLDDLFRKTKATPRIYYLPLSEEQVKPKLEAQRRIIKQ